MLRIAYLDEFGHVGPFVSRSHTAHYTSPVFGLAGIVLPAAQVRQFATWFFQLKCNLLDFEIKRSGVHPAKWEKKGSALYTTHNVRTYRELRAATNRILNRIAKIGGHTFYVGIKKSRPPELHNPKATYRVVLMEAIKRLNDFCAEHNDQLLIIIDEQEDGFRGEIVAASGRTMFGNDNRKCLIEPPIQAESHLYQTLQCADWISGLMGRYGCYYSDPRQYAEYEWANKFFGDRLNKTSIKSGIRLEPRETRNVKGKSSLNYIHK